MVAALCGWHAAPAALAWWAKKQPTPEQTEAIEQSVFYGGCNEVRDAGLAPLYRGQPGYRPDMDGDDDGIACEPIG